MYFDEDPHLGRPHFHAIKGDDEVSIDIDGLGILAGGLPSQALRLVRRWARLHQPELQANWDRARRDDSRLLQIDPLP